MMFYLLQSPLFKWFIALVGSIFLHVLFVYYYFFRVDIPVSELTTSAVIVEFSDPPQSIFMPVELPIGPPQQISMESSPEYEVPEIENENKEYDAELAVEETTPPDIKPEILVQRKEENSVKFNEESNKKENNNVNSKPKKKIKRKQSSVETDFVKKTENKKERKHNRSDKPSLAGSNIATAPPSGTSNKIAAEFNSSGQGNSFEASWRSLVKSHLERNLRYPEQALKKRWKGTAFINIILDTRSNVISVKLLKSSGKDSFDREAVENAKRSSPLPTIPKHLIGESIISLNVPVSFDYEKYRK